MFSVHLVTCMTVQTFAVFATSVGGLMEGKTGGTIKVEVTSMAWQGGFAESVIVGADLRVGPMAGPASPALAWMVFSILMIETTVAEVIPIASICEASKGLATFIMLTGFQQANNVGCLRSAVNDEKGVLSAHHLELVLGRQMPLKLSQLR